MAGGGSAGSRSAAAGRSLGLHASAGQRCAVLAAATAAATGGATSVGPRTLSQGLQTQQIRATLPRARLQDGLVPVQTGECGE